MKLWTVKLFGIIPNQRKTLCTHCKHTTRKHTERKMTPMCTVSVEIPNLATKRVHLTTTTDMSSTLIPPKRFKSRLAAEPEADLLNADYEILHLNITTLTPNCSSL